MAKYDEQGKPVYETAEEYNKAHKKENNSHIYESPEGDAYVHNSETNISQDGKTIARNILGNCVKKLNSAIIKLFLSTIVCVGCVFLAFNLLKGLNDMKEEPEEVFVIETEVIEIEESEIEESEIQESEIEESEIEETEQNYSEEYLGDDTKPLPEGFETFSYNGQTYSLPITVNDIIKMELSIESEYKEGSMISAGHEEISFVYDEKGIWVGMVRISNFSEEEKKFEECAVNYFYIINSVMYDEAESIPNFVFGNGLSFESSYEDFVSYLGIPYYHYEDHSNEEFQYDSYEWSYSGEGELHNVSVTFSNGVISEISIEKITE